MKNRLNITGFILIFNNVMNKKRISVLCILMCILLLAGCSKKAPIIIKQTKPKITSELASDEMPTPDKPITILIHGTRMPPPLMMTVPGLARQITTPSGLHRASKVDFTYLFSRLAHTYDAVDHEQYPLENSYLFGWSGALSFTSRKKAAERLYGYLRQIRNDVRYKNTPITIITVSHGGNVGLNLGAVAQEKGDTTLAIDRLVLLCSPIQDATEKYANSPIFKKVYHLYSSGEMIQVADPQGMYDKKDMACSPEKFFSHRFIKDAAPHVVQAEIQYKKRTLCHVDFGMPHFSKRFPAVLAYLEDEELCKQLSKNSEGAWLLDLTNLAKQKS
jgi:hypothetical protein